MDYPKEWWCEYTFNDPMVLCKALPHIFGDRSYIKFALTFPNDILVYGILPYLWTDISYIPFLAAFPNREAVVIQTVYDITGEHTSVEEALKFIDIISQTDLDGNTKARGLFRYGLNTYNDAFYHAINEKSALTFRYLIKLFPKARTDCDLISVVHWEMNERKMWGFGEARAKEETQKMEEMRKELDPATVRRMTNWNDPEYDDELNAYTYINEGSPDSLNTNAMFQLTTLWGLWKRISSA